MGMCMWYREGAGKSGRSGARQPVLCIISTTINEVKTLQTHRV